MNFFIKILTRTLFILAKHLHYQPPICIFKTKKIFFLHKYCHFITRNIILGSKSGDYEEVRERTYTKIFTNGSLLLQHVKEDREGFYLCQAYNGIGTGIGKVIQLKVNCKILFYVIIIMVVWLFARYLQPHRTFLVNRKW